jgi:glutathione synthase/RimK-type ligase-like ATP-grasp enzyme
VAPGQPIPEVPDHDIAIVTVGESDRDRPVMREIERLIPTWPCPVLNRPDRALQLSRDGLYRLLRGIPGLVLPATVRIDRADFEKLGGEATFPLIARPVGSHAGRGLVKLDSAGAIDAYLAGQRDLEFFISPYVDYRSADGQFRKYRVIWIDGRPYPCHMAIADQWKVWYYNAGMVESPAKRTEEEQFISGFDQGFAHRHAAALAAMVERFGLEYVGIDCAELPDGRLIVFEADISLVVHDMDPPDLYPYKSPAARNLFAAFCDMLKRKSI